MHFHDYRTMKPPDCRGTAEGYIRELMAAPGGFDERDEPDTYRGALEMGWIGCGRPFYNVHPIAIELCAKTSLNMKWGDILFPERYLCLRFASGHEPLGAKSCLVRVPSNAKQTTIIGFHRSRFSWASYIRKTPLAALITTKESSDHNVLWAYPGDSIRDEVIGDTLGRNWSHVINDDLSSVEFQNTKKQAQFVIRLLAFIGLLARGTDLITPAILAADRDEYDATSDESRKRWLEERAARRLGRGFDVGRSLEIERSTSPHWRCPHLALFHTGPGRTTPVLKLRSGCVVVPSNMSEVPTGYLGPEKDGEEHREPPAVFRTAIPSKMRFFVLRRDGYRCRLCGMTADDGVTLECDHIIAAAKGGKTEIPNLWTLCRPCNAGKSDSDLQLAIEENKAMEKARKEVKHGIRV